MVSLTLNALGESCLSVHAFETTSALDDNGQFITAKHAVVNFVMEDISGLELFGFSEQNVIFGLKVQIDDRGVEIDIDPCYDLGGKILSRKVVLGIEPMIPNRPHLQG